MTDIDQINNDESIIKSDDTSSSPQVLINGNVTTTNENDEDCIELSSMYTLLSKRTSVFN